jgi:hypothetical protein
MSAFNEVLLGGEPFLRVQFKHGRCWQYEYLVGDRISWDGMERPESASGVVVVGGIATDFSPSPTYRYFEIVFEDDVIKSAVPISEERFESLKR